MKENAKRRQNKISQNIREEKELFIPIGFPRAHKEVSVTPFGPGWTT